MKKQKLSVGADASTVYTDSVRSKASTEIMHVCPKHQRNTQKGITLIALIITIIILLILAVVSIRLVVNNGILGKAEHATQKYTEEEAAEQEQLLKAEYEMAKYEGKFSGTYTDYVLDKKYGLKIGDYVAYSEAGFGDYTADTSKGVGRSATWNSTTKRYDLTAGDAYKTNDDDLNWRVLGVNDKGELELISDNPTTNRLYLANEEGCLNAETVGDKKGTLDTFCNTLYGNGTGSTGKVVATGARSLNVDDIDKLGGITTEEQKKKIDSTYGIEWTYRYPTQAEMDEFTESENSTRYMQYSTDGETTWNNITGSDYQKFRLPGENETIGKISDTEIKEGSRKVKHTYYSYSVSNYVKQVTSDGKSMADIIKKGTGSSPVNQWLASTGSYCDYNYCYFSVFEISRIAGYDPGCVRSCAMCTSFGGECGCASSSVRPVVSLKSDIQIEKTDANDGSTLAKACIIK